MPGGARRNTISSLTLHDRIVGTCRRPRPRCAYAMPSGLIARTTPIGASLAAEQRKRRQTCSAVRSRSIHSSSPCALRCIFGAGCVEAKLSSVTRPARFRLAEVIAASALELRLRDSKTPRQNGWHAASSSDDTRARRYSLPPLRRDFSFASIVSASTGAIRSISRVRNSSSARLSIGVKSPSCAPRLDLSALRARRALPASSSSPCSRLDENLPRARDDAGGQARELRDLDAVAARGRLFDHAAQEENFPAPFPHRHGKIFDPQLLARKVGQLMKMRREQHLRAGRSRADARRPPTRSRARRRCWCRARPRRAAAGCAR